MTTTDLSKVRVFQHKAFCTASKCNAHYTYAIIGTCRTCDSFYEAVLPNRSYSIGCNFIDRDKPCLNCKGYRFRCNNIVMYNYQCTCPKGEVSQNA